MSFTVAGRRHSEALARQTAMGLALAGAVAAGWLALHLLGIFILPGRVALILAPLLIAAQCWLSVGLFIVAHDAMHGSLAPFRPRLNRAVGRFVLLLYAGIWYDALVARHFAHHGAPGTDHDPDFAGDGTAGFWRWSAAFFTAYLTAGQLIRLVAAGSLYVYVFGVPLERLLLLWALPALLSAVQLFYFGTYLPHRREAEDAFVDRHRARSNDYSWLVSLLTCFHFGYHHEHHMDPSVPWWQLPATRRSHRPGP
jgi:beta-carotene ketolase (CrtW type)